MLRDMANTNITMLVAMIAPPCHTNEARGRIGCDGMIWSQKRTPVTRKLPCMSQMCTAWLFSARSNRAGTCHSTMAALNATSAVHGFLTSRPTARSGPGPGPEQQRPTEAAPCPHRQREQQRDPGSAGHDEDRGVERDEDVLDHVDEEVVVGPVVDGRLHRHQQDRPDPRRTPATASAASWSAVGPSGPAAGPTRSRAQRRRRPRRRGRGRTTNAPSGTTSPVPGSTLEVGVTTRNRTGSAPSRSRSCSTSPADASSRQSLSTVVATASASTTPPAPTATVAVPGGGAGRGLPGRRRARTRCRAPGTRSAARTSRTNPPPGSTPVDASRSPRPRQEWRGVRPDPRRSVRATPTRLTSGPSADGHEPVGHAGDVEKSHHLVAVEADDSLRAAARRRCHAPAAGTKMPTTGRCDEHVVPTCTPPIASRATAVRAPTPHDRPAIDEAMLRPARRASTTSSDCPVLCEHRAPAGADEGDRPRADRPRPGRREPRRDRRGATPATTTRPGPCSRPAARR